MADRTSPPVEVPPPACPRKHWTRRGIAEWLIDRLAKDEPMLVGIDHGFSFPKEKMDKYATWADFLVAFRDKWKSDERAVTKKDIARAYPNSRQLLRLTEQWTSSAKSVFNCNGPGVACSTFAGLPWLLKIREQCGDRVFFWPFDGWTPPADKHVIAEVYPSIFRNRYPRETRSGDQQDAYAVARWLKETDVNGFLPRYFDPPLTADQRNLAKLEGWILGVN